MQTGLFGKPVVLPEKRKVGRPPKQKQDEHDEPDMSAFPECPAPNKFSKHRATVKQLQAKNAELQRRLELLEGGCTEASQPPELSQPPEPPQPAVPAPAAEPGQPSEPSQPSQPSPSKPIEQLVLPYFCWG